MLQVGTSSQARLNETASAAVVVSALARKAGDGAQAVDRGAGAEVDEHAVAFPCSASRRRRSRRAEGQASTNSIIAPDAEPWQTVGFDQETRGVRDVADDRRNYEIAFPLQCFAAGHDNAVWLCVFKVTFDLFELRLVLQRPWSVPCIAAPHMLPSALGDVLGLRKFRTFTAQYTAPHNRCMTRHLPCEPRNLRVVTKYKVAWVWDICMTESGIS
jgi:hypothetical protein